MKSIPAPSGREVTRREAVRLLGVGAAGGAVTMLADRSVGAASSVQDTAPIVRTVLSDVPPARLTGATLIHEHLSMHFDNNPALDFYRDLDLMSDEVRACAADGVSCIVDTGH